MYDRGHGQMDKVFAVMDPTIFCGSSYWLTCMTAGGLCHAIVDIPIEAHALRGGALSQSWRRNGFRYPRVMNEVAMLPAEAFPCTTRLASWRCAVSRIPGLHGGASDHTEHLSAPESTNAGVSQISRPTNICGWRVDVYALTE